jgi:7-keto-8-aminopelargonate synthetase-like enzyme
MIPLAESPPGATIRIDGREYIFFAGTAYLGLQGNAEVIEAACQAARRYGIGSANSRTAFGNTSPVIEVERRAAEMFGLDEAFYFASGWLGNNILTQTILPENGAAFLDEYSHYSVFEAARLSGRPIATFRHRDPDDLRTKLREKIQPGQNALVLSDGVFAATGRIAPVAAYHEILQNYPGSILCIDDAHGVAVLGENGRGTLEHAGLWPHGVNVSVGQTFLSASSSVGQTFLSAKASAKIADQEADKNVCPTEASIACRLIFSGTLSKAVGGFGGIIPGDREFIGRLKQRSPYFPGASAPPTPVAAATAKALELLAADESIRGSRGTEAVVGETLSTHHHLSRQPPPSPPSLRTRLWSNARRLKTGLRRLGFDADDTPVPIVSLVLGTAENMRRVQGNLMQQGITVAYMPAYSGLGPEGALRIAVFATHAPEMIDRLLDALGRVV